jgi:metal-responsive CopG/Arc/MetJ family transcriptional regulator
MILPILSDKLKQDEKSNNNDKVTISAIEMVWNHKQKNVASAST